MPDSNRRQGRTLVGENQELFYNQLNEKKNWSHAFASWLTGGNKKRPWLPLEIMDRGRT